MKLATNEELREFSRKEDAKIGHTLNFKNAIEATYKNCQARFISVNNSLFPFFIVKSKLFGKRAISIPFLDSGGFLGEYDVNEISNMIRMIKEEKLKDVEIRLNSSLKNFERDKKILVDMGFFEDSSRQQIIVTLKNKEEMWNSFHKHTRNDIRKAEKSGLILKEINTEDELKNFYKLYIKNMREFGTPQHSYKFFRNFIGLKENFFGYNCYFENKIAGSIIIFFNNENGYVAFNVSEEKLRNYRQNDFLYWNGLQWAINKGIKFLDLGQVDKDSEEPRAKGLFNFKEKWLGEIYTRSYFRLKKKEGKGNLKKFRNLWRKMPLFVIKLVGPKICSELAL